MIKKNTVQKKSTTGRMIFSILVFVAIVFFTMIFIVTNVLFSNSIERSRKMDTEYAHRLTGSLKGSFDNITRLLSLTQQSFAELNFYDGNAHESVGKILTTLLEQNPDAHSAWVVIEPGVHHEDAYCVSEYLRHEGSIIRNSSAMIREYLRAPEQASWYYKPLQTGKTRIETLNLFDNGAGDGPVYNAIISVPILGNGEIIGACGIDVVYEDLLDLRSLQSEQDRAVMLISHDMTVLQAHDKDLIGQNLSALMPVYTNGMREAMTRRESYFREIMGPVTQEKTFMHLQPIEVGADTEQEPLYLYIETPLRLLYAEAYEIVFLLVTASSVCMLLLLVFIYKNIRKVMNPILALTRQAQQVTAGDFKLESFGCGEAVPDSIDEVSVLRHAFVKVLQELDDNLHTVENRVLERTLELTKLNKYVKTLMEYTTNVSILLDKDYHVLCYSESLLQCLNLADPSQIKGVKFSSIIDRFPNNDYLTRSNQRIQRILGGEDHFVEDDAVLWPDGSYCQYRITHSRVMDDDDNLEGIVIIMRDLTDIRLEEAQLRQDDLMRSTKVPCMVMSEAGDIVAINEEFTRVFDLPASITAEDADKIYSYTHPEFQPDGQKTEDLRQNVITEALANGFAQADVQLMKRDGTPVHLLINAARISWLSDRRLVAYFHDRTDMVLREAELQEILERERALKIQKEAAQAASEAKSQFLANMSHEIRTPMNAVLGMSELLMQEPLSERQSSYVKDIKTSAGALLEIINDILDVSKIQSGKLSLIPVHYDFNVFMDNISSIVQFIVEDKDVVFNLELLGEIPAYLYGDDVRLRQVLLNLLGNAVKFTNAGHVDLTIHSTDDRISFKVSDSGIGIREEDIDKLFDIFEQFDTHKNRNSHGTGLGLSITKSLVDLMGGSISVESVYGQGTSFLIEMPKVLGDETQILHAHGIEFAIHAPDARVLVVDDNMINLNVARGLLQLCGITADTASSGLEAVKLVKEHVYDIIFMDHMMPETDGLETTGLIRELGFDMPIIALTACAVLGTKELMIAAGMDDYLAKPIISAQLKHILRKWLPAEKRLNPAAEAHSASGDTYGDVAGGGVDPVIVEDDSGGKTDEDALFWEKVAQIEGLSLLAGLGMVEGQRDVYRQILRLMIKEIEKCNRNLSAFLAAGNMRGFCIEVHSMKGSLANIGVIELSEKAYALEIASGKEDISFCVSNLPHLLQTLESLRQQLVDAFSSNTGNLEMIEIPPELPPIFESLTDAFKDTDIIVIDECLQRLSELSLTGALGDEIDQLTDAVIMTDFDFAREIIQKLIA